MSSATLTNRRVLKTPALQPPSDGNVPVGRGLQTPASAEDGGFRAWHFFLLASLVTATAAVMMSRRSTPEHLILISLTIIAAGFAAAGFYRMLAPLAAPDMAMFSEPLSERARLALEREKMLVLRSIKELEFDRAMGKLSPKDFDEMSLRLRTRAIALMKQLDEGDTGYREVIERELRARLSAGKGDTQLLPPAAKPAKVDCANCGTTNDHDATFCKRCGARL
jgi:hypothetical protein